MAIKLSTNLTPAGDQPTAIKQICASFLQGNKSHLLIGATGSGKTFTMANVIANLNRSALVIAPNKTLAAQLYLEFQEFFPKEHVGFFISYYDYYQPEAYVPSSDTYIAKDSSINSDIDKMRHDATRKLFEEQTVVIIASVSCIYGLGSPGAYAKQVVHLNQGQNISRQELLKQLVAIQYTRNDFEWKRGSFRVRGDVIDLLPAHKNDEGIRIEIFDGEIESITLIDSLSGQKIKHLSTISIYPNSHYVPDQKNIHTITKEILHDLGVQLRIFKKQQKILEAQRLENRTMQDVETLEHLGFCPGIENYSRYISGTMPGQPPACLMDYFPKDYLTIIDESHITVSQISGMYRGDRSRKETLVNFGFRLPSALDNRPLNFQEFSQKCNQVLYVSATPAPFEIADAGNNFSEQIIRPTGLLDPVVEVLNVENQVESLYTEILKAKDKNGRILITTLTKKMAEDLTRHYQDLGLKVNYIHSDIDTLERMNILRDLRKGRIDVLIGINLLREGLDLPEVTLVAVMDADREGFLRSKTSLLQIIGRAARNANSRVILYASSITKSMEGAISETSRRREKQIAHNTLNNIIPQTIVKPVHQDLRIIYGMLEQSTVNDTSKDEDLIEKYKIKNTKDLEKSIQLLSNEMKLYSKELQFEKAALIRDDLRLLNNLMNSGLLLEN